MGDDMQYIGLKEVAHRVGLSRQWIHQLRKCGQFPAPINPEHHSPMWCADEIEQWAKARGGKK
jgi:predicted DNA-binding transcriptional regulator AlpA